VCPLDAPGTSLFQLGVLDPADPLVAGEGSDFVPGGKGILVADQCIAKV
jgi:hypothetical protein